VSRVDVPVWTWDAVVRAHAARVYRLAYRLTGNRRDADDLTQDVFARVFHHLPSYRPGGGTFEAWLHRVTTALFLDSVRRRQGNRLDEVRRDDEQVQAALNTLPPPFRTAVVLRDVEGLAYDEIAAVLHVRAGTVATRIHRGRCLLRTALADPPPADYMSSTTSVAGREQHSNAAPGGGGSSGIGA
jgi:RNA polymerase sigma factor (sigma-70 family)